MSVPKSEFSNLPFENIDNQRIQEEVCDVCIIGAGYAGLTSLHIAAQYQARGARIILVDRRAFTGGNWREQYSFVRLHQPYQMFTAADFKWSIRRDPAYLATKEEIIAHLDSILNHHKNKGKLRIDCFLEHEYLRHQIKKDDLAIVYLRNLKPIEGMNYGFVKITTKLLIKAEGWQIPIHKALRFQSQNIKSIALTDPLLSTTPLQLNNSSLYIVGSGKSAMDLAYRLATTKASIEKPKINIITGRGMSFFCRDKIFPTNWRKTFGTSLSVTEFLLDIVLNWNGKNHQSIYKKLVNDGYLISLIDSPKTLNFGLLSRHELGIIRQNINQIISGHLENILDINHQPLAIFKSGKKIKMEPDALIVNCTNHLIPPQPKPVLEGNCVVSPQISASFSSGISATLVLYAYFNGKLSQNSGQLFYCGSLEPKETFAFRVLLAAFANITHLINSVPLHALLSDRSNFDKWMPLHKQVLGLIKLKINQEKIIKKAHEILEKFPDTRLIKQD